MLHIYSELSRLVFWLSLVLLFDASEANRLFFSSFCFLVWLLVTCTYGDQKTDVIWDETLNNKNEEAEEEKEKMWSIVKRRTFGL